MTPQVDPRLLEHRLFADADHNAVAPLLAGIRPRWVEKGEVLVEPGSPGARAILLLEGQLRAYDLTLDGGRILFEIIEAGGGDGLLAAMGYGGHFTEAAERSLVAAIGVETFQKLIRLDCAIAVNTLNIALSRLARREAQLETVVMRDPARKIARQLLVLGRVEANHGREEVRLRPRITHQVLADMLGVRRETVTVHLNELVKLGAVKSDPQGLVLAPARLRAIASGRDAKESRNGS